MKMTKILLKYCKWKTGELDVGYIVKKLFEEKLIFIEL